MQTRVGTKIFFLFDHNPWTVSAVEDRTMQHPDTEGWRDGNRGGPVDRGTMGIGWERLERCVIDVIIVISLIKKIKKKI